MGKEEIRAKKGLWADPQPVPTWMYRKPRCGQSLDMSDLVPLAAGIEGTHRLVIHEELILSSPFLSPPYGF